MIAQLTNTAGQSEPGTTSEGAQAVAARLLTERVQGNDFSVHRVLCGQFSLAEPAKPLVSVAAEYSKEGRIAELEGSVTFVAILAADGSVSDLRLMKPLGLGLDETAKASAQRWAFELAKTADGAMPVSTLIGLDFLLPEEQSRWHLVRVAFGAPEGTLPPHFEKANYPAGDGVGPAGFDDARLLAILGRQAVVTLSFDVDETGRSVRFQFERPTQRMWGNEAISIVSRWQFSPGSKDGKPVIVPCKLDLVWGEKHFTEDLLIREQQEFETARLVP